MNSRTWYDTPFDYNSLDDLMEEEKADEDIEGGKDEHHHGNKHLLCARAVEFIQKSEKLEICVHQNI